MPPETQRWRQLLDETFLAQGLAPPIPAMVSNSAAFLRTVVWQGDYLSYLPTQSLPAGGPNQSLKALNCPSLTRRIEVSVTYRERSMLSPASQATLNAIRDVIANVRAADVAT